MIANSQHEREREVRERWRESEGERREREIKRRENERDPDAGSSILAQSFQEPMSREPLCSPRMRSRVNLAVLLSHQSMSIRGLPLSDEPEPHLPQLMVHSNTRHPN